MSAAAPYPNVAVTIDGGRADAAVLAAARRMADLGERGRLSLVNVATVPPPLTNDLSYSGWLGVGATVDPAPFLDAGRVLLSNAADSARGEEQVLLEGYPPEAVCDWAADVKVDLLVIGAHRGREHFSLGSFATTVSRHAPCSVLVVRPERDA